MVGDVVFFHKYRVKISTFKDPCSLYFLRHINIHGTYSILVNCTKSVVHSLSFFEILCNFHSL